MSELEPSAAPEREGLPRGYRMRADAHYVDSLESRQEGPVIRVLNTRHIETTPLSSSIGLSALADSIAAHGILQPLLVRKSGARYELIAGRKRLAAALTAGISDVPCVVHDVDDVAAKALAEADNLRATPDEAVHAPAEDTCLHDVLQTIANGLADIGPLISLLRPLNDGAFHDRATADLLHAKAARAEWLAAAGALIGAPYRTGRTRVVGSIFARVNAALEAEARLTRLVVDFNIAADASRATFDENLGTAVTGMILATLAWVDGSDEPRIEVRIDAAGPRTLKVQVVQRVAAPPPEAAQQFRATSSGRPADFTSVIGLLAARTFAAQYGGNIEFSGIGRRGSVLQSVFSKPFED